MIHEKLEALRLQLNYVCYDKELMPKLSKVWESFFELETEVKKLNIASVVRPEVESAKEGELLGNVGAAKSVRGGKCKHCGQIREGHTVTGMCMDRFKHFESA